MAIDAPLLDHRLIGCISRPYSYTRTNAKNVIGSMKGKPRSILKDRWPAQQWSIRLELKEGEFAYWQAFWRDSIKNGSLPFRIALLSDLQIPYRARASIYTVRAMGSFQATLDSHRIWTVSLRIESRDVGLFASSLCDVIYGGGIGKLAGDVIYAGTPNDLPTDIIEPCPFVVGGDDVVFEGAA